WSRRPAVSASYDEGRVPAHQCAVAFRPRGPGPGASETVTGRSATLARHHITPPAVARTGASTIKLTPPASVLSRSTSIRPLVGSTLVDPVVLPLTAVSAM